MIVVVALGLGAVGAFAQAPPPAAGDGVAGSYYDANALFNRKLYALAIKKYEAFLAANPQHPKASLARYGLALSHYELGNLKAAAPLLGQLSKDPRIPDKGRVYNKWGSCLLALGKNAEAESAFTWSSTNAREAARKHEGLVGLAEAQFRQGKWASAVQSSDSLLKAAPQSPHVGRIRFLGAVARFELKEYGPAAKVFEAIAKSETASPFRHHATYLLAECRREAGDLDGAATLYAAASKKGSGPYAEEALYRLGFVQFSQSKWADAIKHFQALLATYPKSTFAPQASLYLGRAFLEAKQYPKATATLTPLTSQGPVAAAATLWLGKADARQKRFPQVEQALTAAMPKFAKDPLVSELYYELAGAQREQGKFSAAATSYSQAIAAGPQKPQAIAATYFQAFCLHKVSQYAPSLQLCETFLKKSPKHAMAEDVMFLQAENLMLMGKLDEALAAYQGFAKAFPKSSHLNVGRMRVAETYYQKQQWPQVLKAVELLLAADAKGPVFDRLWYLVGDCHFRQKAYDKAIEALTRFVTDHPKHANADTAMFNLATAYKHAGKLNDAMAALNKLIASYPNSAHLIDAGVALGRLLYNAKQYPQAQAALQKAVAAGDPDALYLMGWTCLSQKQDAQAANYFGQMLAKHSQHPLAFDAALQQAAIQVRAKAYPQAQAALTVLIAAQPKHAKIDQAVFYLGRALARQKNWPAATQQFQRVLKEFPKSSIADQALYELAWCAKGAGNAAAAAKHYEMFLETHKDSAWTQDATLELAELEFEAKKYDPAVARLRGLAKIARKELAGKVHYRLGWCYYNKGDMAGAAASFADALTKEIDPLMKATALFQAGESQLKLKSYAAATMHFAAAVATKHVGVHEHALLRLGECQGLTSQWPVGQQSYTTFIQTYPQSKLLARAKFGLGWAQENQKNYAGAIASYRQVTKAGRRDSTTARCQFQIGECLFAMNKLDEAITELTAVERYGLETWSSKAVLEMGRILEAQGKKAEAAERYKEVQSKFPKTDAATVAGKLLKKLEAPKK